MYTFLSENKISLRITDTKFERYPIWQAKELIKQLAAKIKEQKIITKESQRNPKPVESGSYFTYQDEQTTLRLLKFEFRHLFIAYCELRGRKREEIEKPAKNNIPNLVIIESLKKQFYIPEVLIMEKI